MNVSTIILIISAVILGFAVLYALFSLFKGHEKFKLIFKNSTEIEVDQKDVKKLILDNLETGMSAVRIDKGKQIAFDANVVNEENKIPAVIIDDKQNNKADNKEKKVYTGRKLADKMAMAASKRYSQNIRASIQEENNPEPKKRGNKGQKKKKKTAFSRKVKAVINAKKKNKKKTA